jgi:hypothetical protein
MGRSQLHLRRENRTDSMSVSGTGAYPRILTKPTKAGTPTQGQTITGTNGTFKGTGTPTITRQWIRVAASGAQTTIAGQTGATYVLAAGDVGKKVIFQNTATDAKGRATKSQSTPTATIAGA